jgi:membrane protease YdiL (CAAX protease family)
MSLVKTFAANHPVGFTLSLTVAWFISLFVVMGIASSVLRKPYGDALPNAIARLLATGCILALTWRLGWLEETGITRLGSGWIWLLALIGMVYLAGASLYAFYGKIAFDFKSLFHLPAARSAAANSFIASLSEEILFRGLVLYSLARAWGQTRAGLVGSILLAALLFALLHLSQVLTKQLSLTAALLLTSQTWIIAIWWGALVISGGSLWPAVLLHFVVNAVVSVQGLVVPMIDSEILAYQRLFWLSLPLGVLGLGLALLVTPLPKTS